MSKKTLHFKFAGKMHSFQAEMEDGKLKNYDIQGPVSKMITSTDGAIEFLQKVVLDIEEGRSEVPLVFENSLYRVVRDANLPKVVEVDVTAKLNTVFLEKLEGGEVQFGTLSADQPQTVKILTYASGLEITEDMVEYNQNYKIELVDKKFGREVNKLRNKVEFAPILDILENGTGTGAQGEATEAMSVRINKTLQKGIIDYKKKEGVINKPILYANSQDKFKLEGAMEGFRTADGENLPNLRGEFEDIVYYDGFESVQIGEKVHDFPGVTVGKVALVEPKRKAVVYEKHDLRVDADNGDLSRLIENQIVGRLRFGVYIAAEDIVQKVTLP